jgi:hypothetical protein
MPFIPYDLIMMEADRLIIKMVLSPDMSTYYWELYVLYIGACGWTHAEFDAETIKRVDAGWDFNRYN